MCRSPASLLSRLAPAVWIASDFKAASARSPSRNRKQLLQFSHWQRPLVRQKFAHTWQLYGCLFTTVQKHFRKEDEDSSGLLRSTALSAFVAPRAAKASRPAKAETAQAEMSCTVRCAKKKSEVLAESLSHRDLRVELPRRCTIHQEGLIQALGWTSTPLQR